MQVAALQKSGDAEVQSGFVLQAVGGGVYCGFLIATSRFRVEGLGFNPLPTLSSPRASLGAPLRPLQPLVMPAFANPTLLNLKS